MGIACQWAKHSGATVIGMVGNDEFPDKTGTGWHVVIRYHEGHEHRIEGFATKSEAVDWITANATQADK